MAERNRDAAMLEKHLAEEFGRGRRSYYGFGDVADAVGLTEERVREVLRCPQAGHNGVWLTPAKPTDPSEDP